MRISFFSGFLVFSLLAGASCSSDPNGREPARVCDSGVDDCPILEAKLNACGLVLNTPLACDSCASSEEHCRVRCITSSACADLIPTKKTDPFVICEKDCLPWGATAFVCDDLTGFVSQEDLCDGTYHCRDRSDERGCTDAGVTDAAGD